jgi:putative cardiolipin synthase
MICFVPRNFAILARTLLLVCPLSLLGACSSLPSDIERTPSAAVDVSDRTTLGRLALAQAGAHHGLSGFSLQEFGRDAFLHRAALIEAAEYSIDAQYYIWNSDVSGRYLARRLLLAADRGVRVRLLLDDFNVAGRDQVFAALASHPQIEIRIYNPFATREGPGKLLEAIGDFERINRRMHNKTFVVDGAFGIVGGRNIGDEYFGLNPEVNFLDRDMLAVGPIVGNVSSNFDRYWNSSAAYPVEALVGTAWKPAKIEQAMAAARTMAKDTGGLDCIPAQTKSAAHDEVAGWLPTLEWAGAELVFSDPVQEELPDTDQPARTATRLGALIASSRESALMESAYFILAEHHLEHIRQLTDRGVDVRAITNSLASNDLVGNHAGYARSRRGMLESGMRLHELRPDAQICARCADATEACEGKVSLHAKTMVIDREVLYVGSFNLNLRSIYLNGETVLIVRSPALAKAVADAIETSLLPQNSWAVAERAGGALHWTGSDGVYDHEPGTGFWRRMKAALIGLLPIEKYY